MNISTLSQYFHKLEHEPSRLAMTQSLADLFKEASAEDIVYICYLLQGRVVPLYEAVEFGMADKFVIRAIAQGFGVDSKEVVKEFKAQGDLGSAAEKVAEKREKRKEKSGLINVSDLYNTLLDIAKTGGEGSQEKKITMLADVFARVDSLSARYLARIPLGKLRLGFSDMTMLDGLSWMLTGDKSHRDALEAVYSVRPDLGLLAKTVKERGIDSLSHVIHAAIGVPVLPSLCQRIPTASEMIEKMGKVSVEPKYDGVRVQIHYQQPTTNSQQPTANNQLPTIMVKTFSRNLEQTTDMFPELLSIKKQIHADSVILDSEAVGIDPKTGKILPFQETTTRKRKHGIQLALESVPLRFYVFDILYKDGKDLLAVPLSERRKMLQATITTGPILEISPSITTDNPAEIRAYHDEQLKKGLEGVVVKKWDAPYEPGRRGYTWVKFKEEEGTTGKLTDTIDAVVMGYYGGEGKRSGFGIGAFLVGVKDGDTFKTVTKIGTGVSDEQWRELKKRFEAIKTKNQPKEYREVSKLLIPDVWLEPKIVVEIAGDDLTRSPNHGAGYAVRFPRLVRVREDKDPARATSVSEVKTMFEGQK